MDLLPAEVLAEIETRCAAATAGPWRSWVEALEGAGGCDFIQTGGEDIYLKGATVADQDFIAAARQDVPRLIAEVKELRARLGIVLVSFVGCPNSDSTQGRG